MQLGSAIKNNMQVSVENNASHDPKSFQVLMMDDALAHLCNTKDGFSVLQNTESPSPSYLKSCISKVISPHLLKSCRHLKFIDKAQYNSYLLQFFVATSKGFSSAAEAGSHVC